MIILISVLDLLFFVYGEGMKLKNKIALIDVDTFIFQSAKTVEETCIHVTHETEGYIGEYKNITTFYKNTKKDGESGELLELRKERGRDYQIEEFTIEPEVRLTKPDGDITPLNVAKGRFNTKMKDILANDWCDDIHICYGMGTNSRYELAKIKAYKSKRDPKPLLHQELTNWVLKAYKDKISIIEGWETDDLVVEMLYKDWVQAKGDVNKLKYVGVFFDKDIPANTPFLMFNPNKASEGVVLNTPLQAAKRLCIQLIMGDSIDTVSGLPDMSSELREKYGIRKGTGCAEVTAMKLIEPCESIKEAFSRVVEAYKDHYGEEVKVYKGFRDDDYEWNWLDHLNEQYSLLRMRYKGGDVPHVKETLDRLDVEY